MVQIVPHASTPLYPPVWDSGLSLRSNFDSRPLLAQLYVAFTEVGARPHDQSRLLLELDRLEELHAPTYRHCLRVGILAKDIALFVQQDSGTTLFVDPRATLLVDPRAALYAGLLHDVAKDQIPIELHEKRKGWTDDDQRCIRTHVLEGYERLKLRYAFTAEIVLLHHTFQKDPYPTVLPDYLHPYSETTRKLIRGCALTVALADCYDSLHRLNDCCCEGGDLTPQEIRAQMLARYPGQVEMLGKLFDYKVL